MTSNPNIEQEQALRECPDPWCERAGTLSVCKVYEGYKVICGCMFSGPAGETEAAAIAAWNQRSTPTPAQVEPVAWMYERKNPLPARYYHEERVPAYLSEMGEYAWTETPLHAHPPAAGYSGAGRLREADFIAADPVMSADDCNEDGDPLWYAEVQDIGGWSVIATVWGASAEQATSRANAIVAALAGSEGGR